MQNTATLGNVNLDGRAEQSGHKRESKVYANMLPPSRCASLCIGFEQGGNWLVALEACLRPFVAW